MTRVAILHYFGRINAALIMKLSIENVAGVRAACHVIEAELCNGRA